MGFITEPGFVVQNCRPIYNKTKEAIVPQIRNSPKKGSGPKPSPSALSVEEQLTEASTFGSNCGNSLVSVNSTIDAETFAARGDPFEKA